MISILGANSVSGGYEVSNSLRFDDGSSAYLNRTQTAGNRRTWTWSGWIKRAVIDTRQNILSAGIDGNDESQLRFDATGYLRFKESTNNSPELLLDTNALFRDPAAWYHIVVAVDTTQSTDSDRVKIYVNGSQVTSFNSPNYPSQNYETRFNNNSQATYLGLNVPAYTDYYDGYMTEVNFVDGSQKAQTDFGEFNDNGVWVPKRYTGSYGTNGYFLQFKQTGTSQNSSGIGADTSGQGNHFAVSGIAATDVTTDTCTNNFCTLNPLVVSSPAPTLSEGNLLTTPTGNGWSNTGGTILIQDSGKWYAETVLTYVNGQSGTFGITEPTTANQNAYNNANQYAIVWQDANVPRYVATVSASGTEANKVNDEDPAVGDIFQVAYDADNGKIWFGKNNTWRTGNPSTDTSPTYSSITGDKVFHATNYRVSSGSTYTAQLVNFGQDGSFAGNKTAQGNSDANGYGDFYYSPPSGYYALNTKNLAEFG